MNSQRRKQIAKAIEKLTEVAEEIRAIADEECEYYENMPENLQQSERGERADETASTLEAIADELDNQVSELETAAE